MVATRPSAWTPLFDPKAVRGKRIRNQYVTEPVPPPIIPPVACFTWVAGDDPLEIDFDAGCSTDDGTIVGWAWDFGDSNTSSTGSTVSHTYSAPGFYDVTLVVEDDDGAYSDPFTDEVEAVGVDTTPLQYFTTGWTSPPLTLLKDGNVIYALCQNLATPTNQRLRSLDVTDPTNISGLHNFAAGLTTGNVPRNLIKQGIYVLIMDSNNPSKIVNVSNPSVMTLTGTYQIGTSDPQHNGSYLHHVGFTGLAYAMWTWDLTALPTITQPHSSLTLPSATGREFQNGAIDVANQVMFCTGRDTASGERFVVSAVDVSNKASPSVIATAAFSLPIGFSLGVSTRSKLAGDVLLTKVAASSSSAGFVIATDVSNTASMSHISAYGPDAALYESYNMELHDDWLFIPQGLPVTSPQTGLVILDVSDPSDIQQAYLNSDADFEYGSDVIFDSGVIYVASLGLTTRSVQGIS